MKLEALIKRRHKKRLAELQANIYRVKQNREMAIVGAIEGEFWKDGRAVKKLIKQWEAELSQIKKSLQKLNHD